MKTSINLMWVGFIQLNVSYFFFYRLLWLRGSLTEVNDFYLFCLVEYSTGHFWVYYCLFLSLLFHFVFEQREKEVDELQSQYQAPIMSFFSLFLVTGYFSVMSEDFSLPTTVFPKCFQVLQFNSPLKKLVSIWENMF